MDFSKIISIAGKPGLYRIINQSRGGILVSSVDTGKKMAIGQTQRVSALSDISVYTDDGDMPLDTIFERIHAATDGEAVSINTKDDDALRTFFTEVMPEHDQERVYHSDIRKVVKWFNLLLEKGLLSFDKDEDAAAELSSESASSDADQEEDKAPKVAGDASADENTAEAAASEPSGDSDAASKPQG